jgi:hypothetical protein
MSPRENRRAISATWAPTRRVLPFTGFSASRNGLGIIRTDELVIACDDAVTGDHRADATAVDGIDLPNGRVAFPRDGLVLASAGSDGKVILWPCGRRGAQDSRSGRRGEEPRSGRDHDSTVFLKGGGRRTLVACSKA